MILEVGPGAGRYRFNPRAPPSLDTVYLDIGPPRDHSCGYELCDWVVADAEMLPFRSNAFEGVYASHVIEHLRRPERFLKEARRVLRDCGELYVWAPNFLDRSAYEDPDHKHFYNSLTLWRELRRAGFSVRLGIGVGTLVPEPIRKLLAFAVMFLLAELHMVGVKDRNHGFGSSVRA